MSPLHIFRTGLLTTLILGGCSSVSTRPSVPVPDAAASFSAPIAVQRPSTAITWWERELGTDYQTWIGQLLKNNPAIQIAGAEAERQLARRAAADADLGPSVDANVGSSLSRNDGSGSAKHTAAINASLPLDLSGQLSAIRDARSQEYIQALAQLEAVRLEQMESLLLSMIDHAEARQREILLKEQINTTQKQLHLTEIRFRQGLVSSVDVLQQRDQIASLQQQLPEVHQDARLAANRISELTGLPPAAQPGLPDALTDISPGIPVSRPIELLQRRPDLLSQQAALAVADAEFEAALRARLPSLTLDGSALWQILAGNPSVIIQAALDASVSLFDSGAREAEIQARRAVLSKAGTRYLQDWLAAVRETDDLLNTLQTQDQQLQLTHQRLDIAHTLYRATLSRYQRGVSDYLPVLTALRDLQQQQRDALRLKAERQKTLIRLKTAIGLPAPSNRSSTGEDS